MKRLSNHAVSYGLLLLYTSSQLVMLIESAGCHVSGPFFLWVALLCLSTWVAAGTRRGWLVGMPSSVLLICIAFYVFPDDLMRQMNDALDRLTGAYLEQVVYPGYTYSYLELTHDHSLLFLFLAFLLASYMGAALCSRSGRVGLALLGSVPLFSACLAVTIHPPVPAVFGMLLFWLLLAAGGGHYEEDAESYRSVLCLLLPLALLLGGLIYAFDPERYVYEPKRFDLTDRFDELIRELDEKWDDSLAEGRLTQVVPNPEADTDAPANIVLSDANGGLDLTQPFDPASASRVYLRVRSEQNGLLYLRAASYGDYLGSSWAAAEDFGLSSLSFTAAALEKSGSRQTQIQVELLSEGAYRYLPYFSTEAGASDSYVLSGTESRYTASFYPFPESFSSLAAPESLVQDELSYRAWAHEAYTRLPEATRAALAALCEQAGLSDTDDLVRDVAAYVQQTGRYSLETEPYPSGDYAVYFLTAAREGWCLHFATAAVALYRTLGVPARLVEGFLVETEAGRYVDVKGENAHAWVEIYQDGLGWLPVEVTGQSGAEADALGASEATPEPSPEPTAVPGGELAASTPTPVQPVNTPPSLSVGLLTQESLEQEASVGGMGASLLRIALWVLAALLLLSLLPLRRLLLLYVRRRSFEQDSDGRAVVAMYRCAERAALFSNGGVPEPLTDAAEKAVFSRGGVTPAERRRCRVQLETYLSTLEAGLRPFDRFRFRWLYVFQ